MCCSESHIFILFLRFNLVGERKSDIGVTLTISQWEFYLQVYDILSKNDDRFSKGDLKAFIHWIFKYFMHIMWELVLLVEFWDKVWKKLYFQQSKGDFWVGKFHSIFRSVYEVIESFGKSSGNVKSSVPQLLPQLLSFSPRVPVPSSPQEMSGDGKRQNATCILPSLVLFCPLLRLALIKPA